ncbi:MAG: hypothetical protein JWP13_873 [Candidatus Saccharibacteria bacterium]|nr:hypothetical protein [Candidatus Saccharibacteria bacterium]
MTDIYQAIGFGGAVLVLLGYLQVSRGKWRAKSHKFQRVNALGAAMLLTYGLYLHAYPNVLVNTVWLVVALGSIYKLGRR